MTASPLMRQRQGAAAKAREEGLAPNGVGFHDDYALNTHEAIFAIDRSCREGGAAGRLIPSDDGTTRTPA